MAQGRRKFFSEEENLMPSLVQSVPRRGRASVETLTPVERRTLGGVLGFIAGLAAFGPFAAVAGAALGAALGSVRISR